MNKTPLVRHGGILAAFAVVTTGLIAITFQSTQERIAAQVQAQRLAILNEVIPHNMHDNALYSDCIVVSGDALGGQQSVYRSRVGDDINAFALETTATNGYSGDIDIIIGFTPQLEVLGVRILRHKETPGLGDKVELSVSDWVLSFTGKQYSEDTANLWQVKKDGGQFDQFTGATITPRAVVNSVAQSLKWANQNLDILCSTPSNCQELDDE